MATLQPRRLCETDLFAKPSAAVNTALMSLVKDAAKLAENPAGQKKALVATAKTLVAERTAFGKAAKDAEEAIGALTKTARDIKKNPDVAPELAEYGKLIVKSEKIFDALLHEIDQFDAALKTASEALPTETFDEDEAKQIFFRFRALSGPEKAAKAAAAAVKKLKPQFLALSKKLA